MERVLVIPGATAGMISGGFFAYKGVMHWHQNGWVEDPLSGAAGIYQRPDVLAV